MEDPKKITEMIMVDPQELAKIIKQTEEVSKEQIEKFNEYIANLSDEQMIEELKHLLYRNISTMETFDYVSNDLSVPEVILLEKCKELFAGVVHALKWIAFKNGVDYKKEFGDCLLVHKIDDFTMGKEIVSDQDSSDTSLFDFDE